MKTIHLFLFTSFNGNLITASMLRSYFRLNGNWIVRTLSIFYLTNRDISKSNRMRERERVNTNRKLCATNSFFREEFWHRIHFDSMTSNRTYATELPILSSNSSCVSVCVLKVNLWSARCFPINHREDIKSPLPFRSPSQTWYADNRLSTH